MNQQANQGSINLKTQCCWLLVRIHPHTRHAKISTRHRVVCYLQQRWYFNCCRIQDTDIWYTNKCGSLEMDNAQFYRLYIRNLTLVPADDEVIKLITRNQLKFTATSFIRPRNFLFYINRRFITVFTKIPSLSSILSQFNLILTVTYNSSSICFNIILPSTPIFPKWSLLLKF